MINFVDKTKPKGKTGPMSAVLGSFRPAGEPTIYCPVGTCTNKVPEHVLVCRDDISQVPEHLIDAYRASYEPGQNALTASRPNKAAYAAIMDHFAQATA